MSGATVQAQTSIRGSVRLEPDTWTVHEGQFDVRSFQFSFSGTPGRFYFSGFRGSRRLTSGKWGEPNRAWHEGSSRLDFLPQEVAVEVVSVTRDLARDFADRTAGAL